MVHRDEKVCLSSGKPEDNVVKQFPWKLNLQLHAVMDHNIWILLSQTTFRACQWRHYGQLEPFPAWLSRPIITHGKAKNICAPRWPPPHPQLWWECTFMRAILATYIDYWNPLWKSSTCIQEHMMTLSLFHCNNDDVIMGICSTKLSHPVNYTTSPTSCTVT